MSGSLKSRIGSSHSGLAGRTYSCYLGQLLASVKMQRWWQSGLATILSEATTTATEEHSLGTREQTHTISTIVTFSSQRERKCCYQEDISRDLGKRALLGWLVEIVLSSAGVYSEEFLKNSVRAEHPEKSEEGSLVEVLHYKIMLQFHTKQMQNALTLICNQTKHQNL